MRYRKLAPRSAGAVRLGGRLVEILGVRTLVNRGDPAGPTAGNHDPPLRRALRGGVRESESDECLPMAERSEALTVPTLTAMAIAPVAARCPMWTD